MFVLRRIDARLFKMDGQSIKRKKMMKVSILSVCVGLCVAVVGSTAVRADIIAPVRNNAVVGLNRVPGTNEWNVTIDQVSLGGCLVLLDSNGTNDIIRSVTIINNSFLDIVTLTIRKNQGSVARSAIQGVERIDVLNPSGTILNLAHIAIDGDIGASGVTNYIEASTVGLVDIGGDLLGNIIIDDQVTSALGDLPTVQIDGDVVDSGIYNNTGDIGTINISGSVLKVGGGASEFWSSSHIQSVTVGSDFEGRIGSNSEGFAGHPDVGDVFIGGDFTGTSAMEMQSLGNLSVGGDFNADVTINTAMGATSFYDIAGTLATDLPSGPQMSLPADGLVEQVVFNSGNTGDSWTGSVDVDGISLGVDYTNLSSEIGGGAVGLAPFNFHQRESAPGVGETRDCNPYQNEAVTIAPLVSLNEVVISHYGSVYAVVNGAEAQFRVEFRPDIVPFPQIPAWADKTSLFEIDTTQTGTSALTGQRTAVIKATASNKEGFKAAGRWRIRPIAGKVKCSDVSGNPDVAYNSSVVSGDFGVTTTGTQYDWYAFRVFLEAPGGSTLLNTSNGPQASDLTAWVSTPFEINADGETNAQDFIDMAEQYTGE